MWAFAKLKCRHKSLMLRIATRLAGRLSYCNAQDVANFMWGFGELRVKPGQLLNKLPGAIVGRLNAFSPQVWPPPLRASPLSTLC